MGKCKKGKVGTPNTEHDWKDLKDGSRKCRRCGWLQKVADVPRATWKHVVLSPLLNEEFVTWVGFGESKIASALMKPGRSQDSWGHNHYDTLSHYMECPYWKEPAYCNCMRLRETIYFVPGDASAD
jgi:hypothetical protein